MCRQSCLLHRHHRRHSQTRESSGPRGLVRGGEGRGGEGRGGEGRGGEGRGGEGRGGEGRGGGGGAGRVSWHALLNDID